MTMRPSVDPSSPKLTAAGPDGRLAKYVCSYCGKRFNRPSSLKVSLSRGTLVLLVYAQVADQPITRFALDSRQYSHWR